MYEKTHKVSEDATLQYMILKAIYMDMKNHSHLIMSSKRSRSTSSCSPSYILEESDVRILDPEGLVNKDLGTHDLDTKPIDVLNLS